MIYEIDGKFYILASNKYREIKIEKDAKNEYNVKLVDDAKPIERTVKLREKAQSISVEAAYIKTKKSKNIE